MGIRIDISHREPPEPTWAKKLRMAVARIDEKLESIMATNEEFAAVIGRIDTATDNIAADILRLKAKVEELIAAAGLSGADEAALLANFDRIAANAEAIASSTEDPAPEPEPEPTPEEPPADPNA